MDKKPNYHLVYKIQSRHNLVNGDYYFFAGNDDEARRLVLAYIQEQNGIERKMANAINTHIARWFESVSFCKLEYAVTVKETPVPLEKRVSVRSLQHSM